MQHALRSTHRCRNNISVFMAKMVPTSMLCGALALHPGVSMQPRGALRFVAHGASTATVGGWTSGLSWPCRPIATNACRRVCRRVYGHACRHACRHAYRVCGSHKDLIRMPWPKIDNSRGRPEGATDADDQPATTEREPT